MSGTETKNFDSGSGSAGTVISGRKKARKFVNLWIDFREDSFPVYFYSESESYSLKSIQRITNSLAFSCQKFRYRHCRNRNRNSWFLFRSPPTHRNYLVQFGLVQAGALCSIFQCWPVFANLGYLSKIYALFAVLFTPLNSPVVIKTDKYKVW